MPLVSIQTNVTQFPVDFLRKFATEFSRAVGKKSEDIEICLSTLKSIHFNGNSLKPAAYILYQTTDLKFGVEERRLVVVELSRVIKEQLGIKASRLFIRLEQLRPDDVGISGHLYSDLMKKSKI